MRSLAAESLTSAVKISAEKGKGKKITEASWLCDTPVFLACKIRSTSIQNDFSHPNLIIFDAQRRLTVFCGLVQDVLIKGAVHIQRVLAALQGHHPAQLQQVTVAAGVPPCTVALLSSETNTTYNYLKQDTPFLPKRRLQK